MIRHIKIKLFLLFYRCDFLNYVITTGLIHRYVFHTASTCFFRRALHFAFVLFSFLLLFWFVCCFVHWVAELELYRQKLFNCNDAIFRKYWCQKRVVKNSTWSITSQLMRQKSIIGFNCSVEKLRYPKMHHAFNITSLSDKIWVD